MMMQGMGGMQRPDPSKMADKLFSSIDTSGKGYIEKSDLTTALGKISSSGSDKTSGTASVDDVFKSLDSNSDGKITKQEMTDSFQKIADAAESQFQNMRMSQARQGSDAGGMQPPGGDVGFTKDELSSQLSKIGSSGNDQQSSLLSNLIKNFDAADSNGDGKVSAKEAMAYDKSSSSTAASQGTSNNDAQVMNTIMKLLQTYASNGSDANQSGAAWQLSV